MKMLSNTNSYGSSLTIRRGMTVVVSLVVLLACSGCVWPSHPAPQETASVDSGGSSSAPADVTLEEAREYQNRVLEAFAAFVPPEAVAENLGPIEKMKGMRCDWYEGTRSRGDDAGVMLPGGQRVSVVPGTDLEAVRQQIADHYAELPDWEVKWEPREGWRALRLDSPDGYGFYVDVYGADSSDPELALLSFSPCLKTPEGFSLRDEY